MYEGLIYGHDREGDELNYSPEVAWHRLYEILNDKVMIFNPYLVGDEKLVECAMRGYWRDFPALTQMLVFTFVDLWVNPTYIRCNFISGRQFC